MTEECKKLIGVGKYSVAFLNQPIYSRPIGEIPVFNIKTKKQERTRCFSIKFLAFGSFI
jgi:hypothetical protein